MRSSRDGKTGSWDNNFKTPSNYYLYNSGQPGAAGDFMQSPHFTFIPWDYDNCLGIGYFGTQWQYTDILDWGEQQPPPTAQPRRVAHSAGAEPAPKPRLPSILPGLPGTRIDTEFNPDTISAVIGAVSGNGLWAGIRHAAYPE